jgi:hypothetical protein
VTSIQDNQSNDVQRWADRLIRAARSGEAENLGPYHHSNDWPAERRIPAAALREVLVRRDLAVDPRGLRIRGARFVGDLQLANISFRYPLELQDCRVDAIDLTDSSLHALSLNGSHVDTLTLLRAELASDLRLDSGFHARGVDAIEARIGGRIRLTEATLSSGGLKIPGGKGQALVLDGAVVSGGMSSLRDLIVRGQLSAVRSEIGQVGLWGSTFENPNGDEYVLVLDMARIKSGLFLRDGFTATGGIRAASAHITGPLDLIGARLSRPGDCALLLQGAHIDNLLFAAEDSVDASVDGCVDLTRAVIGDLVTPETGQPPGMLNAPGWQIADIYGGMRKDWHIADRWVKNKCPKDKDPIAAQSWHAVADVYDRNGQPSGARRLRLSAAMNVTKTAPWYRKLLRTLYLLIVGHGYYPLAAAAWMLAIIVGATILVSCSRSDVVPSDLAAANQAATAYAQQAHEAAPGRVTAQTPCASHPDYPCFGAFAFAVPNLIPGLGDANHWKAAGPLNDQLVVLRVAVWVLSGFLLAGLTGLLYKA